MRSITLELGKGVSESLKREAKRTFPNEAFAYLLGVNAGTLIVIDSIWTPEHMDASHGHVTVQPHWIIEAQMEAKEDGLEVVGDWHSHPYYSHEITQFDGGLSERDCQNGWHGVCGLCVVLQRQSGRLVSRNYFYGPMSRLELKAA